MHLTSSTYDKTRFFGQRSNPRLTFWLGFICGMIVISLATLGYVGYLYNGGKVDLRKNLDLSTEMIPLNTETVSSVATNTELNITDADYILGNTNAATTLVVYFDFECELCKIYHRNIINFVNTHPDQIRLVMRNFVIDQLHPQAQGAAAAAICAGEQGKYYEYADQLFENQKNLNNNLYMQLAQDLSLTNDQFKNCLLNDSTTEKIKTDYQEGLNLNVHGIPNTIVIFPDQTKKLIDGNVSVEFLESLLKENLS